MGSVVLYRDGKEANVVYLVDGQQRITTTIILLSILRDELKKIDEDNLAEGIQNFLITKDADNKDRFILEHTPPNSFFQNIIMLPLGDKSKSPGSREEVNIASAQKLLSGFVTAALVEIGDKSKKVEFIKKIRDRILSHQYISVELDKDEDAYLVFETLNTRGKDLRISDLVKNHFAKNVKGKAKSDDPVQEKWGGVIRKFDSVKTPYSPDDFLLHYWLAKEGYVSKAKLFREFKDKTPKATSKARLEEVTKYADAYIEIVAPKEAKWTKQEQAIQSSLLALSIFRVAQALPLVLAIMRLYRDKVIKIPQTASALRLIENFTFQFNAVTQSRGGGGISAMYAKLAQGLAKVADGNQFSQKMKEVREKFVERLPSASEFDQPFATLIYRADYTRERELVRYALIETSIAQGMGAQFAHEAMTIEHVLSQSQGEVSWESDDVGAIGNLVLVTEDVNNKLDSKDFEKKKVVLAKVPWLAQDFKDIEDWDAAQISKRGLTLAKLAREKVWKV